MKILDQKLFEHHKKMYYSQWGSPGSTEELKKLWKEDFKNLYGTDDVNRLFGEYFIYGNESLKHD